MGLLVGVDTRLLPCWARRQGLQSDDGVDLGRNIFTVLVQTLPDSTYDLSSDGIILPLKKLRLFVPLCSLT